VGIRSLRWTFSGRGRSTKEIRLVEATEGERSPSVCAVGDTERWLSFPALEDAGTSGLERGLEGRPCRWEDLAFEEVRGFRYLVAVDLVFLGLFSLSKSSNCSRAARMSAIAL